MLYYYPVVTELGCPESRASFLINHLPQEKLFKACRHRQGTLNIFKSIVVKLPFACDRSVVTSIFQEVRKRGFPGIQVTEVLVVTKVLLPRHDFNPRRRTQRLCMGVLESHAVSRKFINMRR